MARMRNRYNQKARQVQGKQSEKADPAKKIPVDVDALGASGKYDEANQLVLPSKKVKSRKTSVSDSPGQKLLSRKQRKKLEKIVERRGKKSNRAELLEELQKHQLPPEKYAELTPLVQVQSEGLKKLMTGIDKLGNVKDGRKPAKSVVKGTNQLKYRSWSGRFGGRGEGSKAKEKDPMVLGLNEEESSSEDDEEDAEISDNDSDNEMEIDKEVEDKEAKTVNPVKEEVIEVDQPEVELVSVVTKPSSKPKQFVSVNRTPEISAVRAKLPIIPEEQIIMESVTENAVTLLAGETGSGKTTQVPQFLYEAGYTLNNRMIGVTEPRRVAAIAMAHRVAKELNLSSDIVSYQIRFEGNTKPTTQIKFMTDGVLLKEMEKDFLLQKYSAICIDEAHERSLYTDILIGLLSRCALLRLKRNDPLKLIIMSATMRVEDFSENQKLFKSPPRLIHVPTRQFPVQIHFNKHTPDNYLLAAYKKTAQIHKKLPPGGILIFLTGQQEVRTLVTKLRKAFPQRKKLGGMDTDIPTGGAPAKFSQKRKKKGGLNMKNIELKTFDLDKIKTMPLQSGEKEDEDVSDEDSDLEDEDMSSEWDLEGNENDEPLYVLPLYSMLPSHEQQKVFETPPQNMRLCVVATNVAETSLTIPSIRYVIDSGKVKTKEWDKLTGVQQFSVTWCSKASAEQRSGRAGRTGPGHCYRLYSSAVYDSDFSKYSPPEILLRPVDDMMLFMKSIGIDKVQNFPFPTHPGEVQLAAAEQTLINLGALEPSKDKKSLSGRKYSAVVGTSKITDLGKTMSYFPLSPRFSKMLALSFHHSVVEYTIALVAALTVQEVFLDVSLADSNKESRSVWTKLRRQWAGTGSQLLLGDSMVLLRAVGAFEYEGGTPAFCEKAGLRFKAMQEIRKLRKQLTSEVNMMVDEANELPLNPKMKPPSEDEACLLRQVLLSGLPDKIARKIDEQEIKADEDKKKLKFAYKCGELEEPVLIHPLSVLRTNLPEWVVYQEVFESNGKMYMRGITAIEPSWIPAFCKNLCQSGPPILDPPPRFDSDKGVVKCSVKSTYGKQGWSLPIHEIEYPFSLEKFKLFGQYFLEGKVFSKMEQWKEFLLSMPITMTKPWARLQPRTQKIMDCLTRKRITSREGMLKEWENDKNFMLEAYLDWLPTDYHIQVTCSWPPI